MDQRSASAILDVETAQRDAAPGLVQSCLAALPMRLLDDDAAPRAGDRTAWLALPEDVRARLVARGEAALSAAYPPLPASAYLAFTRTGDRTGFETAYMQRRRMLNALVLAECAEHTGRFVDAIVDGVFALCEESGWQLPAHNTTVRNARQLPLPDESAPIIDLFAAETGAQLALTAHLLQAELDAVSPQIVRRIDREIERRIVRPYLERRFWWMGEVDGPTNNWTAWCTANVLVAVFNRPNDPATRRRVVERAARSLDAFLAGYGGDGACEEGVLYYRHAGLALHDALGVLDRAAPGVFASVWRAPKIRAMAEFVLHMHVADRTYFNFGDSAATLPPGGVREYRFAKAVGSEALADFAAADFARQDEPDLPDEISLSTRLAAAFTAGELRARPSRVHAPADVFLESVGLLVARDAHWALAVSAGHNGVDHNHNDVGHFTLYRDGRPVAIDVGVETYTAKTFSPRRYEIWTMQSAFHNVPTFGDVMQRAGAAFGARCVEATIGPAESGVAMDLASAYPPEAGVRSYRRRVRLLKGRGVEVADVHDGDRPAVLSLMLAVRPVPTEAGFDLPGLAHVGIAGAGTPAVEEIEITDARLRLDWPGPLYRVLIPLSGPALTLTFT